MNTPESPNKAISTTTNIRTQLPNTTVGIYLSGALYCLEVYPLTVDTPTPSHSPWLLLGRLLVALYLLFCVYRIHEVISEATGGAYPISPSQATFLNIIPIFNFYWVFRWTNQIATFLNDRNSKEHVPINLAGALLVAAAGLAFIDSALFFAVAFLVVGYLNDKIRTELALSIPSRRNVISVSVNAGLGAASGLLVLLSIFDFADETPKERRLEILAIVVVGFVVVKFLEPITERFKKVAQLSLGEPEHSMPLAGFIRIYVILLAVGTSLAHGFLHVSAEKNPELGPILAIQSLILPGVITYCWLAGARDGPPRASLYGLISGALISCTFVVALFKFDPLAFASWWIGPENLHLFVMANTCLWTLLGFAGGWVIDKSWGAKRTRGIMLGLVVCLAVIGVSEIISLHALPMMRRVTILGPWMALDLARAIGWGAALMLDPNADALFAAARPESSKSAKSLQWLTISLWLLLSCALIFWFRFLKTPLPDPAFPLIKQLGCTQEPLKNPDEMTSDEFDAIARSSDNIFIEGPVFCLGVVDHPIRGIKVDWDWILENGYYDFNNGYYKDVTIERMSNKIGGKKGTERIWQSFGIKTSGHYRLDLRFDESPVRAKYLFFEVQNSSSAPAGAGR